MATNKQGHTAGVKALDGKPTAVPGQAVLHGMQEVMGYDTIKLSGDQERFCWEYVENGGNGRRAWKAVKPETADASADVAASRLLRSVKVQKRLEEIRHDLRCKYSVTADDLVAYHGRVMKIDRREFFKEDGSRYRIQELPSHLASIVDLDTTFSKDAGIVMMPVVASRQKSADSLARMMGLDKAKLELTGKDGGPVESVSASAADELTRLTELRELFNRHGSTS